MYQLNMSREVQNRRGRSRASRTWGRIGLVFVILLLPGLLGAWRIMSGETLSPRLVQSIKDGKTTKQEIMVMFGDPQEINRTPEGVTYIYKNYKDAPAMPYKWQDRKINPQSDQPYVIGADKQIKKAPIKTEGKILRSTLSIQFKKDGQTVMSHEFEEY
ncbi:MAG TPA: hypothetical protein VE082_09730 [Desulfobaccales bacterium]|nr:hypothetical protein [Desulfobaccales bacterium]